MAVDLGDPTQFPNAILHVLGSISVGFLETPKEPLSHRTGGESSCGGGGISKSSSP